MELIRELMPHAFIGVDVIVGTRGEEERYFEECYQFLEGLPFSQLHVFSYSEREGTGSPLHRACRHAPRQAQA